RKLGELLGGKGKVAVVGIAPGSGSGLEREGGFQDTIKKEFPNIEMIGLQYCDSDRAKALAVAEDFLTRAPDLAGMFASNESSAVGVFRAIEGRGKKGQIKIVGFDASPDLLDALRGGTIDALVVQNPFKIGYEGVKTAVAVIRGQPVEKRIDTGVVVVTRDNLESADVKKVLGPCPGRARAADAARPPRSSEESGHRAHRPARLPRPPRHAAATRRSPA